MKIIVPIKRVPDPYGRVRLTPEGQIDESDIKWVINPFDEIALEEAGRIRESGADVEITAVTVGRAESETQLRTALAMGADRADLLLTESEGGDPTEVSKLLADYVRTAGADLVLMGKQAIDNDFSQVGQRLAALLSWPQATFASKITLAGDGKSARVVREVDSGRETLDVALPAVITADLRLNEPRYLGVPAIIKARTKPLNQKPTAPAAAGTTFTIVRLESPPRRKAGRRVASVDELITALKEEARVI